MPSEKFDVQTEKKAGDLTQKKTAHVTAVTQKKLMNARIMKSKSPVRYTLLQSSCRKEFKEQKSQQDKEHKQSIFKGPVNKEFFKKVENRTPRLFDLCSGKRD